MCKMRGTLAKSKNVCATPRNFQPSALLFDFKRYRISLRDKIILVEQISVSNVPQPFDHVFGGVGNPCRPSGLPRASYAHEGCPTPDLPNPPNPYNFKSMGLEGC